MPEWCSKVLNDRPNSNQEPALSSIHAQALADQALVVRWKMFGEKHLEVDCQQGEEGTEGSKE